MPPAKRKKQTSDKNSGHEQARLLAASTDQSHVAIDTALDLNSGLFHLLAAGPPVAICFVTMPSTLLLAGLVPWMLVRMMMPKSLKPMCAHFVTVYIAHNGLGSSELTLIRLAKAICLGLTMGVAYRNGHRALRWAISSVCTAAISTTGLRMPARLAPPRAASVLLPLPDSPLCSSCEFVVKVLLPTAKFSRGMVYNEKRTLQAFVDLESDCPGMATLVRLIASEGGDGGVKGYFLARREPGALRVYIDRILPEPAGW